MTLVRIRLFDGEKVYPRYAVLRPGECHGTDGNPSGDVWTITPDGVSDVKLYLSFYEDKAEVIAAAELPDELLPHYVLWLLTTKEEA